MFSSPSVFCLLYSVFLIYCLQNITPENHPFVEPAKEAGRGFGQSHVAQATIHVQGLQVVLSRRAHLILSVELRAKPKPHHESTKVGNHEKGTEKKDKGRGLNPTPFIL